MKTKKKFDSVKMMREIRNEINSEISKMTPKQILDYFKKGSLEFNATIAKR